MPHSPELNAKIYSLVEQDYPATQYRYQFDKAIPGTRKRPDILVWDQVGYLVCVVEIGYTRPEKLTAYRDELKIPDVRWYDKQGRLHTDVKQVAVVVQVEPTSSLYIYCLEQKIQCPGCLQEWRAQFSIDEFSSDDYDVKEEFLAATAGTETILVTDYVKVWFACSFDQCSSFNCWFDDDSLESDTIIDDLKEYPHHEFGLYYGKRSESMSWSKCVELVRNKFNLELRYEGGRFIDPDRNREYTKSLMQLRQKISSEAAE
jgi:hypothetical protein